jgi:hypothetical protein
MLAMTARNATDPDLWWHLRTGQWIAENGRVPHSDIFSFTRAGHPWISHEWLSEVIFYELWKHGGTAALIIFSAGVTTLGLWLLFLRCPGAKHWAAAVTVFGALAAAPAWGTRPQMFTFTLASLLLFLVERGERQPKLLFLIPPLFLLWLNLHAGFAVGAALLLAYVFGLTIEVATGNTPWSEARRIIFRIALLLIACFAVIPINPSGVQLYFYPFQTLQSSGMRRFISEWHSPDFHDAMYRPFFLILLLLLVALASHRSRPQWRTLVPLLFTAFGALDAARHIPIFVLLAIPVIAAALPVSGSLTYRSAGISRMRPILNVAVLLLLLIFASVRWLSLIRNQDARVAELFPVEAADVLISGDFPRDIFVYYDWGSYAIWKLYPEYRVFIDGRADVYGDDLMRDSIKTVIALGIGWREILANWRVEAMLLPPSCPVAQVLTLDPTWRTAYADSKAILLVRRPAQVEKLAITLVPSLEGQKREKMFPGALQNLRN